MSAPRVLAIAHNHPSLHPGGTEIFAHDLFGALKARGAEALFVACTNQTHRPMRPGTYLQTAGRSADEVILWCGHFDRFYQSQVDLQGLVPELSRLLRDFAPDIIHVHHSLLLGVEMLFLMRRVLPGVRIVYTLHDYYPICAQDGLMVTPDHVLCQRASPHDCHRCLPDRTPDKFVLREKHIKALFALVDRFVSPSEFLKQRYVEWGLPADRIEVVRNGRPDAAPASPRPSADGRRNVFGYFGNISRHKGALVALEAARRLAATPLDFTLHLHGGMPFQAPEFRQQVEDAVKAADGRVIAHGPYRRDEMAALLAGVDWALMPSTWWENAPLVIQEAFQQRRPVICSGIGGMAEAVRDGIDGLHARAGDPADLARAMARAAGEPGLWDKLRDAIPAVTTIGESAERHLAIYRSLLRATGSKATGRAR